VPHYQVIILSQNAREDSFDNLAPIVSRTLAQGFNEVHPEVRSYMLGEPLPNNNFNLIFHIYFLLTWHSCSSLVT
jgi:hypothetical protein